MASVPGAILSDGGRRSLQSQLDQLVANARTVPDRIDAPHPADQSDQFRVLCRSPTPPIGFPSPGHPESGSLPADDSLRANDHQRRSPIRPNYLEYHPDTPVPQVKLRPVRPPFEHRDLVPQSQNFHSQFVLRSEQGPRLDQHDPKKFKHTSEV